MTLAGGSNIDGYGCYITVSVQGTHRTQHRFIYSGWHKHTCYYKQACYCIQTYLRTYYLRKMLCLTVLIIWHKFPLLIFILYPVERFIWLSLNTSVHTSFFASVFYRFGEARSIISIILHMNISYNFDCCRYSNCYKNLTIDHSNVYKSNCVMLSDVTKRNFGKHVYWFYKCKQTL